MRLTSEEVTAIKAAARFAFGESSIVRVFGSRADDTRVGGDIDLHVEVDEGIDMWRAKMRFEDNLFARIEEQKVDVTMKRRDGEPVGIDLIAMRDGVTL